MAALHCTLRWKLDCGRIYFYSLCADCDLRGVTLPWNSLRSSRRPNASFVLSLSILELKNIMVRPSILLSLAFAAASSITKGAQNPHSLSIVPEDVCVSIIQYLGNMTRPFGWTCRRHRNLIRQQELCRISKSFEMVTSRAIIPKEFIYDEFTELLSKPSDPSDNSRDLDRRLRHLPLKQVRMFRTTNSAWSRLVIPVVPLCESSYFYLVFQFSHIHNEESCDLCDSVQLFGFVDNGQSSASVTTTNGILDLLETLYRGEVVRIILRNSWRGQCYWKRWRKLGVRVGVPWTRKICSGMQRMFRGFGCCMRPQCGPLDLLSELHHHHHQIMKEQDEHCDIVMTASLTGYF